MQLIKAVPGERICIGYEGEHLARQVCFDISEWAALYGEGTAELIYQRPKEETPYPVASERKGNEVFWTVTATDVARAGMFGRAELRYYVGETLVKSDHCYVTVLDALGIPEDMPAELGQAWLDQALSAGIEAKRSADRAEAAAVRQPVVGGNGNWWVFDVETEKYVDTGFAATVEIVQSDWSQDDSEAADYIKNRPFYDAVEVLLPATSVECDPDWETAAIDVSFALEDGEAYVVEFDGMQYECVAKKFDATDEDGNPRTEILLQMGINLYISYWGADFVVLYASGGTHIISISRDVTKKIDSKYLPTETWVFTLEDGSTLVKKVVVTE